MVLLMVNEAARCLEEGIVESADDVDFGMVMGTGFAPFRGGPLRYADSVGVKKVAEELTQLAASVGAHFAPCALLTQKANLNQRFHED
jgi:3-hydroxyacyl-CoA dehydrogenase/enoyl-CoA hydratase/3-hydroxybutyryl-CoA epimerase